MIIQFIPWWARVIIAVLLLCLLIVVIGYFRQWKWTGAVDTTTYANRTLWDWLDLLFVPLVLAIGAFLLSEVQENRQRSFEEFRSQETAFQGYLDQMSLLLLHPEKPLRESQSTDDVRIVASARTTTVLRVLDPEHKRLVVLYLDEAGLIQKKDPLVDLDGANLIEADLHKAPLSGADLHGAILADSPRDNDQLGAYLRGAQLKGAHLKGADLQGADLTDTDLTNANLADANLRGAYILNSEGSRQIMTNEELRAQTSSLEGATMPNGQKYEDWLKDKKAQGKGKKNE